MIKVPKQSEILNMGFILTEFTKLKTQIFKAPEGGHPSGVYKIEFDPRLVMRCRDINNKLHNDSGAAVIHCSGYSFMKHGLLHRYDGPAQYSKYSSTWHIHDTRISEAQYRIWLKDMGMDIDNLSDNDKILIDMKWKK